MVLRIKSMVCAMKRFVLSMSALLLASCATPAPPPAVPSLPTQPTAPVPPPQSPPARPPRQQTAGPLTKANVEKYLDGLERGLRVLLRAEPQVRVMRRGDSILVVIPNARLFSGDDIGVSGTALVAVLARALRYYDHTVGQVNGYTDTAGPSARNVQISQIRAQKMLDALVAAKVAGGRFSARGLGPENLRIVTGDQKAETRNRRIEIAILPKPE
jgi:outer membrane protein OmpA-like peptidoglycan-associated protein